MIYLKNLSSSLGPLKSSFVSVIYSVSKFNIGTVNLNVWTLFLSAYVAKSFPVQRTTPSTSSPDTLTGKNLSELTLYFFSTSRQGIHVFPYPVASILIIPSESQVKSYPSSENPIHWRRLSGDSGNSTSNKVL